MIHLVEETALASGSGRSVFQHPHMNDVVIKIHFASDKRRLGAFYKFFRPRKRRYNFIYNSMVEVEEFASVVAHNSIKPDFISQFLGFVNTTIGAGVMFEAVTKPDGSLADTLLTHAELRGFESKIISEIDIFWDSVIEYRVAICDSNLSNLVVTGGVETGYKLVLIDGLGDQTLIPLQSFSRRIHAARADRKRRKMKASYKHATTSLRKL